MRLSISLAIAATLAQGALVLAAPLHTEPTGLPRYDPTLVPEPVNYEEYYKALRWAMTTAAPNNQTSNPAVPSVRAIHHSVTMIYCVNISFIEGHQNRIFPDVHGCEGWHYFSFLAYKEPIKGITGDIWNYCENSSGKFPVGRMTPKVKCAEGNWKHIASGYDSLRDVGSPSRALIEPGRVFSMEPSALSGPSDFKILELNQLGILDGPSQERVDAAVAHIRKYPSLYQPLNDDPKYSKDAPLLSQLFINNLSWIEIREGMKPGKITNPGQFSEDLERAGLTQLPIRIELQYRILPKSVDGITRATLSVYAIDTSSGAERSHWMAGLTLHVGAHLKNSRARSILTESLRDHSFIRVQVQPENRWWTCISVPNTYYSDYVPMYMV